MFGIGGGELIFIVLVVLVVFGSDKIPEMARSLGKGMNQLRNATNEIKSEIRKGASDHGLDTSLLDVKSDIEAEIDKARQEMLPDVTQTRQEIEDIVSGPIKRQH